MFGVYPFGVPYFGDAINIDHAPAQPRVLKAFAKYEPIVQAFARQGSSSSFAVISPESDHGV